MGLRVLFKNHVIKPPAHNWIIACADFVKIEEKDTELGIFFLKPNLFQDTEDNSKIAIHKK